MFGFRINKKIGPLLAGTLAAPVPAGNVNPAIKVVAICSTKGLKTVKRHHDVQLAHDSIPFAALSLTRQQVLNLAGDRGVVFLEQDDRYATIPKPLVTCGPRNADVFARYKVGPLRDLDGEGIRILVQDSGFSPHADIRGQIRSVDCTADGTARDFHGHGTAIVSQLAATGRYPGLVPKSEIIMARIFDRGMGTTLSRILRACAIALDERVNVVSMSYGGPIPNPVIAFAMNRLHAAGICLFAAAGNSGPGMGTVEYPGGYDTVTAIAAVDKSGRLAPFSSRGRPQQHPTKPDLALEGVGVVMAQSPDGTMGTPVEKGYIMASGTSFACPIGAALAAMILQAQGARTNPARVAELLRESAHR